MKLRYYYLITLLVLIVQISLRTVIYVPDLSLLLLLLFAFQRGEREGSLLAIMVGLIQDMLISPAVGLYAISKLLVAYIAGWLGTKEAFRESYVTIFSVFVLSIVLHEFILWGLLELYFRPGNLFWHQLDIIFLQGIFLSLIGVGGYERVRKLINRYGYLFKF